jgi:cellulose synthase (UDP-forming)
MSRRNTFCSEVSTAVLVDGVPSQLLDVSVGGAAIRSPGSLMHDRGEATVMLPGAAPIPPWQCVVPRTGSDIGGTAT